ncbi:hypothetical protein WBP_0472 [Wolbachia endosymbiont of Brugia pahangi]|nr:hypothetical protein WBP_0472 [Wolbachia endosymbiont of Brugia pahangi]
MTCYSVLQLYDAYSHGIDKPYFSNCKPLYIFDRFDNRPYFDRDYMTTKKFSLQAITAS